MTESAAPGREGPCRSGQRLQAQAGRTRLGEAEARARAHPRRRLSRVAGTSGLGGGIRDRARRALRPVRVRLRRRLAPKVSRRYWPGIQATAYLSSYFAGGRGRKMAITENVFAGDLPRLVVFVGRELTLATGCTMRSLRTARRLWAARAGLCDFPRLTCGSG